MYKYWEGKSDKPWKHKLVSNNQKRHSILMSHEKGNDMNEVLLKNAVLRSKTRSRF